MTRFNTEALTATGRNLFNDKKKKKAPERSSGTSLAVQPGEPAGTRSSPGDFPGNTWLAPSRNRQRTCAG